MINDLLPKINKLNIPFQKSIFIEQIFSQLSNSYDRLILELEVCKKGISELNNLITISNIDFELDSDSKCFTICKINSMLSESIKFDVGDCKEIINKYNSSISTSFNINIEQLLLLPNVDIRRMPTIIYVMFINKIEELLSIILHPLEKKILEYIISIESNIEIQLIDYIKSTYPIISEFINLEESYFYNLNVDDVVNEYGMLVNGEIDFKHLNLTDVYRSHFTILKKGYKIFKSSIELKTNKIF